MGKVVCINKGRRIIPRGMKILYLWQKTYEYLLPQFERIEEERNRNRHLPLPPYFYAKEEAERMADRLIERIQLRGRLENCYRACIGG